MMENGKEISLKKKRLRYIISTRGNSLLTRQGTSRLSEKEEEDEN